MAERSVRGRATTRGAVDTGGGGLVYFHGQGGPAVAVWIGGRVDFFALAEVIGKIERGFRVNERIRAREVRVIDDSGAQLGVMTPQDALQIARERDLDLIEVAPNAQPPVCRIMDYGKHRYEQAKRERETRKRQKSSEVRLIRVRNPQISQHDLDVKLRKLRELIGEGSKVRITLRFRGREMSRPELGTKLFERIAQEVSDVALMESSPRREGRMMNMMLTPKPGAKPPKRAATEPAERGKAAAPKPAPNEKAEKQEKAQIDVQRQVEEKLADQPHQAQNPEDSGEAG